MSSIAVDEGDHGNAEGATAGLFNLWLSAVAYWYLTGLLAALGFSFGFCLLRPASAPQSHRGDLAAALRWMDGRWYTQIATEGYHYDPGTRSNAAFFPVYPLLGRDVMEIAGIPAEAALVMVSNVSFLAALGMLTLYVRGRAPIPHAIRPAPTGAPVGNALHGVPLTPGARPAQSSAGPLMVESPTRELADWAVLAAALCPTGCFFRLAYSESTCLLLLVLAMYAMQRRWPLWAIALMVGLATAARPVGVALLAPFAVHVLRRASRRLRSAGPRLALYLPLACWGLAAFIAYQNWAFGEPLAMLKVQRHWGVRAAPPWPEKAQALATFEPVRSVYDDRSPAFWAAAESPAAPWFSLRFASPPMPRRPSRPRNAGVKKMTVSALPIINTTMTSGCGAGCGGGGGRPRDESATLGSLAEAVRGNQVARRMPRLCYMELILTDQCNLRCSYCFEKDKNPHQMSDETAIASIDFLMEESGPTKSITILFFGGEPLLRFDLMKRVHAYATAEANKRGKTIHWDMTTNGTLMTEEKAAWLAKARVNYLLSLDGGKEDHDRYRKFANGRGSFEVVAAKLPIMKRFQPWLGAKISVTPESGPNLARSVDELHRRGINQFILGYAHGLPWTVSDLARYEQALYELCELYLEKKFHKQYFRMSLFEEGELGEADGHATFGCGAGRGRCCVDSYGDIYGCSKLATITGMHNGVLPYGNVFQGFTRIDNRLQFMHTAVGPREKCRNCEFNEVCGGGCPAVNYKATGSIFDPDDLGCRIVFINQRVHAYMRQRTREIFGAGEGDDLLTGPDTLRADMGGPCVES